jgi:RNA polymerase sigma-70 factor (ECF subfamily)
MVGSLINNIAYEENITLIKPLIGKKVMKQLKLMTDEQLVQLYANGNNNAFDVLLNRHKSAVHSYIYYIVRDKDLTDDIFQETFVKAIVTIKQGKYTENGKFKAWITRIAHNLVIDNFRQEKNENTLSNDDVQVDLFNDPKLCDKNVEEEIVQTQIFDDVKKLITFLPDNQKEVLHMRYYQNMSFKDIADKTGVSINTALGRMRYAVLNMRKMVEENKITLSL